MEKKSFTKRPTSYDEQISLLERRGLTVESRERARFLLQHISYYRLSGYWYFFLEDKTNHRFVPGTSFDDVFDAYCFDKEMRNLLMRELEKVEVGIRAAIIYTLSHKLGAFWYTDPSYFADMDKHNSMMAAIESNLKRSDEIFYRDYQRKYTDRHPPSWMVFELMTFGNISKMYSNMKTEYKNDIANMYELPNKVFESWLHSLVYIRNVCAHHSRLWNRNMSISPKRGKQILTSRHCNNRSIYFMAVIIQYNLNYMNPNSSFKNRLSELFSSYPIIKLEETGFHANWDMDPVWQ